MGRCVAGVLDQEDRREDPAILRRRHPLPDTISPIIQSGSTTAPDCPSGKVISGTGAKNIEFRYTFSRNAFYARFTPNGAFSIEL